MGTAFIALATFMLLKGVPAWSRGATVPWLSYEAEDGIVDGGANTVGPGRKIGTPEGEASGRKAVMLKAIGASVSWKASAAANSIVVRNCIPDAAGGGGIQAKLGLYVNGIRKASLTLSSAHSWVYGGDATQSDNPGSGPPRKIYDESALLFKDFSIAPGDMVKLQKDAGDAADYYAIDFIDLEQVAPPLPMPAGFLSVTDGDQGWAPAVPDDGKTDDAAINKCIAAAQSGKFAGVWFPPGVYDQANKFRVKGIAVQGAGMWHSKILCNSKSANEGTPGETGFTLTGDNCRFRDFALFGYGGVRAMGGKAFLGPAFKGAVLERLWIESVRCGYWVGDGAGPSNGLLIKDCRIRNTGADGVNLYNGSQNGLVVNCHLRNTGDDALAIWSAHASNNAACINNVIRNCTVQITWRAACFAIYGGTGNRIENCQGSDALTYPGLTVSSEFNPFAMQSATVDGLDLYRCGGWYWSQEFGAIWLFSADAGYANVTLKNIGIFEPTYSGIHVQSGGNSMSNVLVENVTITNPTTFGVQIKSGSRGAATFRNVLLKAPADIPAMANQSTTFTAITEAGAGDGAGDGSAILSPKPMDAGGAVTFKGRLLKFTVPGTIGSAPRHLRICLRHADGKMAAVLIEGDFAPGSHELRLDKGNLGLAWGPAGMGILSMELDGRGSRQPVVLSLP